MSFSGVTMTFWGSDFSHYEKNYSICLYILGCFAALGNFYL